MGAGVGVGRRVVVVGDPGWSGKRNVGLLECLEQSGIIEWIWNKKRRTKSLRWKNVHLGRLKKHSIHSDGYTRPRGFLRWHHREYNPLLHCSQTHSLGLLFHLQLVLPYSWVVGYRCALLAVNVICFHRYSGKCFPHFIQENFLFF